MAKKNNPELPPVADEKVAEHPDEGGSYTRCPESGDLTLVARTSHEPIDEAINTNVDSQESQA